MQQEVANNSLHITVIESSAITTGFFGKIFHALGVGWSFFLEFFIALLALWPFLIVGCVILFFIIRSRQQKKETKDAFNKMFNAGNK